MDYFIRFFGVFLVALVSFHWGYQLGVYRTLRKVRSTIQALKKR